MIGKDDIIVVEKSKLPKPLVVVDDRGNYEIQELQPAGKKRLGACVGKIHEALRKKVERLYRG